jgi:exosortase
MIGLGAWLVSCAVLYGPVLLKLTGDWRDNATYSHGFLVPPIALFLVWQQRDRLTRMTPRPAAAGLVLLAAGLGLFVLGTLGAELFLTRVSLLFVLAGTVAFVCGWAHLRIVAFPIAILLFMIPLPAIVFDRIAVSLQLVASMLGAGLLHASGYGVVRHGNVLMLPTIALEVTDACSGIRSLVSLLLVTVLAGWLGERSIWRRMLVALLAIPLAIVLNGVRIAATGVAATWFGPAAAAGLPHEVAGWLVFVAAAGAVWGLQRVLRSEAADRLEVVT